MNIASLIRDAAKVQSCLQELPDSRLIALKECKIYIPSRFAERGLAEIGVETYIVGLYAIVVEDQYYGVSTINARLKIEPTSMLEIKIKGTDYLEFTFAAGSIVFSSTNLVKDDIVVYKIYDEVISKGRVPWYLNYEDLGHIFDTAGYHAGARIGENSEVTELIISIIARDPNDRVKYYRTLVNNPEDLIKKTPAFIPLRSVTYAATNTMNKLAGSYWSTGVVSALVSPSERSERIESLLLK